MTTAKPLKSISPSRAGLWSTITTAISGGWGTTARMLVILVALGAIVIGVVLAIDERPADAVIRALIALV